MGLVVPVHIFYPLIIKYCAIRGGESQFKGTDERESKHSAVKGLENLDVPQDGS